MDSDPKSNGPRIADQSTYPRLVRMHICEKSGKWIGIWEIEPNTPMVQAQDWTPRFDPDQPSFPVAR